MILEARTIVGPANREEKQKIALRAIQGAGGQGTWD